MKRGTFVTKAPTAIEIKALTVTGMCSRNPNPNIEASFVCGDYSPSLRCDADIHGLRALPVFPFDDIELHQVFLLKRPIAFARDASVVDENIPIPHVRLDESVTLAAVEPQYRALRHHFSLSFLPGWPKSFSWP